MREVSDSCCHFLLPSDNRYTFFFRELWIESSPRQDTEPDLPLTFDAFIRPFPRLVEATIIWTPFPSMDPRATEMANAPSPTGPILDENANRHADTVRNLTVRIRDNVDRRISDEYKINQFGHLLRQLSFTDTAQLTLDLGEFMELHTTRGGKDWFRLISALKEWQLPNLKFLDLDFGHLHMNGRGLGIDFVVSRQNVGCTTVRFH